MKIVEKLLNNFYSEIIQYLNSIKKLTEKDPDAKKYYNELGKNLYNAEISGLISYDEITQKQFLKLFKRLDQISKDITDMDLGVSFDDASDFYDNFKSEARLRENKNVYLEDLYGENIQRLIKEDLKEYGSILEFKVDLKDVYDYDPQKNFYIFYDDINDVDIIAKVKPLIKGIIEYKFYVKDKDNMTSFSRLPKHNPKNLNTVFKIFLEKVLPNNDKILLQPFDYPRYRLFRATISNLLDKKDYNIQTNDDPLGQSSIYIEKKQ